MSLTKVTYSMINGAVVNVLDYGADNTGASNTSAQIQNAIDAASSIKGTVYFPAGTYKINAELQCSDKYVSLIGESVEGTILQATSGFNGTAIGMVNTNISGGDTGEVISNMTISGSYGGSSVGIDQKLTSRATIKNVIVIGFNIGIRQIDNFCFYAEQVEVKDCQTNWHLVGSNHNSEYVRCGAVGFGDSYGGNGKALLIEYSGADNLQSSLAFRGCDFEFGDGDGVVVGSTGTVIFDNCYMESVGKTMFTVNDGNIVVSGGEYIIEDSAGYLVYPSGGDGKIYFTNQAAIASNGVTRIYPSVIKSGGSGNVYFENTTIFQNMLTTNLGVLPVNLGRIGIPAPYFSPRGRDFSFYAFSGAASETMSGSAKTVTCTSAGFIGVYQQLSQKPFVNAQSSLVIKYASNTSISVTFVSAAGQSAPVATLATLPNTSGNDVIFVVPTAKTTDDSQDVIEFWKSGSWSVNDYLTVYEVWYYSGDPVRNGQLSLG